MRRKLINFPKKLGSLSFTKRQNFQFSILIQRFTKEEENFLPVSSPHCPICSSRRSLILIFRILHQNPKPFQIQIQILFSTFNQFSNGYKSCFPTPITSPFAVLISFPHHFSSNPIPPHPQIFPSHLLCTFRSSSNTR